MKNAEGNQDLWRYTRLGKIEGLSSSEFTDLLGNGAVELILFTE